MTDPTASEVKDALVWLDGALTYAEACEDGGVETTESDKHRATINRLLAQPRLPAEPNEKLLDAMICADGEFARDSRTRRVAIYRALYAELTKPKEPVHMPTPVNCPYCGTSPGHPHAPGCSTQKTVTISRCPTCFAKLGEDGTKPIEMLAAVRKELERIAAYYLRAAAEALDSRDEVSARDFARSAEEMLKLVELCAAR